MVACVLTHMLVNHEVHNIRPQTKIFLRRIFIKVVQIRAEMIHHIPYLFLFCPLVRGIRKPLRKLCVGIGVLRQVELFE